MGIFNIFGSNKRNRENTTTESESPVDGEVLKKAEDALAEMRAASSEELRDAKGAGRQDNASDSKFFEMFGVKTSDPITVATAQRLANGISYEPGDLTAVINYLNDMTLTLTAQMHAMNLARTSLNLELTDEKFEKLLETSVQIAKQSRRAMMGESGDAYRHLDGAPGSNPSNLPRIDHR